MPEEENVMSRASKGRSGGRNGSNGKGVIIRRFRTDPRTGIVYDAWKYGYKGWPMTPKKR